MRRFGWGVNIFLATLGVLVATSNLLSPPVASALSCDGWYGHACWRGYFKDQLQSSNGQDVINGGLDAGDKASFITAIQNHLNSGDAHRATAAQFIILSMSGAGYMPPKSVSQAQFDDWVSRVNNPAVTFVREDALFQCDIANSFYQTVYDDIAAGYSTPSEGCGAINTMLDFYVNGSLVYRIRVACANPLGNPGVLPGLPPGIPPTVVSCGTINSFTPPHPEVGDDIQVSATISYTGGPPGPPVLTNQYIKVSGVGDVGVDNMWNDASNTYYLISKPFKVPTPGRYSVTWSMTVNGVAPNPDPCGGTFSNSDSVDVFNYPYIDVKGGDTAAGARFSTAVGQPCGASNTNAGIVSWNKDDPTYSGGGGQYGASAFSVIEDFLTNKGNANGASFTSLSFAGLDVDQANGNYGGSFGKGPCVDYWSKAPAAGLPLPNPTNQSLDGLSGIYVRNGDLTINPSNIGAGTRLTIYVTGRVAIKGNIKYGGGSNPTWANMADVPSLKIIVRGSIFVDSSVDQLDGTYVAVPDSDYPTAANSLGSPNPGTISTCSSGFSVLNPAAGNVNACRRTLTVNGSFAANTVYFLRTIGSMSNGTPAEQFNYNPEVWLAPDSEGSIDPAYQSIVGLPPVL